MRSYTQMVVQCAAVQCAALLQWLFNAQLFKVQAVQCAAILQWLFNTQLFKAQAVQCVAILQWLFNPQLGWVRSSILKYQVDNRCNFTDRMEKVGQIEIEKLMTKMT